MQTITCKLRSIKYYATTTVRTYMWRVSWVVIQICAKLLKVGGGGAGMQITYHILKQCIKVIILMQELETSILYIILFFHMFCPLHILIIVFDQMEFAKMMVNIVLKCI